MLVQTMVSAITTSTREISLGCTSCRVVRTSWPNWYLELGSAEILRTGMTLIVSAGKQRVCIKQLKKIVVYLGVWLFLLPVILITLALARTSSCVVSPTGHSSSASRQSPRTPPWRSTSSSWPLSWWCGQLALCSLLCQPLSKKLRPDRRKK